MSTLKIATWNVNGVRARHSQLLAWAQEERPDVLCLQELKATAAQVPDPLTTLSDYWSYWHGGPKGYSGVSLHLLRKTFPEAPKFAIPAIDMETRIVQASVGALTFASIYVPNGGKDYDAKLAFLRALGAWAQEEGARGPLVLCGDMNVTRTDRDVHPSQLKPDAIGQRPDERALFEAVLAGKHNGSHPWLEDVCRNLAPTDDRLFTWWPAWRNSKERNLGWRIDYVLASPTLKATAMKVQREVGTSDHAPVVVDIDDPR